MLQGTYRFPTINDNSVVFVCEDDLWSVSSNGGRAVRLTAGVGECSRPLLAPDGTMLAFTAKFEGAPEIYCMESIGGAAKRLTFLGANTQTVGWTSDGSSIILSTNARQPFPKIRQLYTVSARGGEIVELPYGVANNIAYGPGGGILLGRNTTDPALWKRYRGGTAGVLWINRNGAGEFERLCDDLQGNIACPLWIEKRIYFISDHEGVGNLYSCEPEGGDIRRESSQTEFYARNASTDGKRIAYHAGGDIFIFDPSDRSERKLAIELHSHRPQSQRRFVGAAEYLDDYTIHPKGHSVAVTTRGKPFALGNWDGHAQQLGASDEARYRLIRWLPDGERCIVFSDECGEERIEIYNYLTNERLVKFDDLNVGRPIDIEINDRLPLIAIANHRLELLLFNYEDGSLATIARSEYQGVEGMAWSPDGEWLAYSISATAQTYSIRMYSIADKTHRDITDPAFRDVNPAFDPDGKYLYFLSFREFNPVYDAMYFDLNFPRGVKPYLITLQKDAKSPFTPQKNESETEKTPKPEEKNEANDNEKENKKVNKITIDFEGIAQRIVAFPVAEGKYTKIAGVKGKAVFSSVPMRGSLEDGYDTADGLLEYYDFEQQKKDVLATGINDFVIAGSSAFILYRAGKRLRVISSASQPAADKSPDDRPSKKSGWIDLNRIKVSVNPALEWRQMFRELWRLQRDHYWTADMAGIDWDGIYRRYLPLLDRVATRVEFSDLVWELQGELGTSHAYEHGGDFRPSPNYRQGFLGADYSFDEKMGGYRIDRIIRGDSWVDKANSPLAAPGVEIAEGDILLAINARKVGKNITPEELLVNLAGEEARLTIQTGNTAPRSINIKTLGDETNARYRNWVERNKNLVHEATGGRVGYVHLPNMGPLGFAEFHRYYFREVERDGLIVDVRFNGGGHVSQLILEKLARKRIAYTVKRWGQPHSYPHSATIGPMIAIANEYAGSDGDIFCHCFKLMNLGKLVGKRTWGGVIGISPRHRLADGTVTTQPEFSFWFVDAGWGVENYGVSPDIEVDIAPRDYSEQHDPQLVKSIEFLLNELERNPVSMPTFDKRPRLAYP